jgi:hypothetical protein
MRHNVESTLKHRSPPRYATRRPVVTLHAAVGEWHMCVSGVHLVRVAITLCQ